MGKVYKKTKKVYGVGTNDADYTTREVEINKNSEGKESRKIVWSCPYYGRWSNMLERCYSVSLHKDRPSYESCSADPEWLSFMSFRSWMKSQKWEGKHLDKDLLVPNNKLYSPETCLFIPQKVNSFITGNGLQVGEMPLGVRFDKRREVFQSVAYNKVGGKKSNRFLLTSKCPVDCHSAWLEDKLKRAKELASEQDDIRVAEALVDRYENFHKYFPQTVYGIPLGDYKKGR